MADAHRLARCARLASSSAMRVFPTPPGPVSVSTRAFCSRRPASIISSVRPTKLLRCISGEPIGTAS